MTSQDIKRLILNYDMSDELLLEYLEIDFNKTIVGVLCAFYDLLINYDKNRSLIEELLDFLENIGENLNNMESIKKFHSEIKRITSNIYKNFNPITNYNIKIIISRLQIISKNLKKTILDDDTNKKIEIMETIINEHRNLKVISSLIRDNKNILKIKDVNGENILYKILKKYSCLAEKDVNEINYLYQVISLFVTNDDINIEIIRNVDYYISALKNKSIKHVKQVLRQLELKKHPILLSELEKKFQVYTKYSSDIEGELNNLNILHNGALDLREQQCFTIDGEDSTCLDDAIYFKKNKDGTYYLYVHITFIPSLISYFSKINIESIKRVETYYLLDEVYSLYPDYISNYLASLLPGNVRYTETGIWLVEPDMTLVEDSFRLVKSTIKSHHRLTYDGADEIIGSRENTSLCQSLTDLGVFALKQRDENRTKESYRKMENAYSNNPIHESRLVDRSVAANIVQECALLFGRSKAELYKNRGLPYIFRACGEHYELDLNGSLLKKLTEENQKKINSMLAYYTFVPEMHYGLGYEAYCHGGSPARRSPDGQNQYIDEYLIFNPDLSDKMVYMWEDRCKKLVEHYNASEQRIEAFSNHYNYLTSKKLLKKL